MSLNKKDVKRGIDKAAGYLKSATDTVAQKSSEGRERVAGKAKEAARNAGDQLIQAGQTIKRAVR
jgi:hypothetical protein